MSLGVRVAGVLDGEAIAALHAESWQRSYRGIMPDAFLDGAVVEERRRHWRHRLAAPGEGELVLLAEDADGLAGFTAFGPDPADDRSAGHIDNLHVAAGRQGRGVGRRLLGEAAARLAEAGRRRVHLWVFDANARALRFYLSLGGEAAEHGFDLVEGTPVAHTRIVWSDTAALAEACRSRAGFE
ncbi:MAG TPA: GNAT family N-acetyltransferase [Geminicoccaceae bacterium]|nr:GNAT family N-acetyltransferase [Geminicoccus sp.]HMU52621.1 GNAT family N-acetyltransferase [Geminicoccaceae bacterium]